MGTNLKESLSGSFVVVNLGAGGDPDYNLPSPFLKMITLIEADGGTQPIGTSDKYHRKYTVRGIIAGDNTPRRFVLRKYWGCSSIYEPRQDLIRQYGLEDYFEAESCQDVVPVTLSEILQDHGLDFVDYLKTDLEGVDFEVIKSCENFMDRVLAIKCELRFQPFFHGEPFFHEVASYLQQFDFELVGLKPVYWKPVTAHKGHRDGRVVFADCLFFKKSDAVRCLPKEDVALAAVKQVIIAVIAGKKSYADWLLDQYRDILPEEWQEEVGQLVIPRPIHANIVRTIDRIVLILARIKQRLRKMSRNQKGKKSFDHLYSTQGE